MSFFVKFLALGIISAGFALFFSCDSFEGCLNQVKRLVNDVFSMEKKQTLSAGVSDGEVGIYDVVSSPADQIFTKAELAKYDGTEGSPGMYLAILGRIYDVGSGSQYYGPGGGYSFFTGLIQKIIRSGYESVPDA